MPVSKNNNIKNIAAALVCFSGIPWLVREFLQKNKTTFILYHDIDAGLFEKHITKLKKRYSVVPLGDYLRARKEPGSGLPPKPLVITFDDGHKDNYKLLPVFKKYKLAVTIFICSAIVDTNRHYWFIRNEDKIPFSKLKNMPDEKRLEALKNADGFDENREYKDRHALSGDEIREMAESVDFQSHTRYHRILPSCPDVLAEEEIGGSKNELEEKFGLKINSISYPNGDYTERDVELTHSAGYECGITVDPGFNSTETNPFKLKRICVDDGAGIYLLLLQVSGVWTFLKKLFGRGKAGYDYESKQ